MEDPDLTARTILSRIRDVPDHPKKGIMFKDITPLLKDSDAFNATIEELARRMQGKDFDYIAGIEARGFIIGSALSYLMKKGFVPIRKKGKLPYKTISKEYMLEYGASTIEMHSDAIEKGSRVIVVDDLLATGGTAAASAALIEILGGVIAGFAFIIELSQLNGRDKLRGYDITALVKY
ncbi:MAG: adenine phosphoribosyltransferase [Candidatus Micrarchaeaceae archaeon]